MFTVNFVSVIQYFELYEYVFLNSYLTTPFGLNSQLQDPPRTYELFKTKIS